LAYRCTTASLLNGFQRTESVVDFFNDQFNAGEGT
jgi:hypothetical protein